MYQTKENTKVSIICPYYKGEKYLESYLQYVEGTYLWLLNHNLPFSLELIIDVNLPSENDLLVLNKYKDCNWLKILVSKDKLYNWSESANRCIKESTGIYITLWGIDDIRVILGIWAQVECLVNDSNLGAISGDFVVYDKYDDEGLIKGERIFHEELFPKEKFSGMLFGPFFMFRKSVIDKIGYFDEQLKSGGDYDFVMRLVRKFKTSHLPMPLGMYLNAGEGNSTNPNSLQPLERTVIELRYGLYDKIEHKYTDKAKSDYFIDKLSWNGHLYNVYEMLKS